MAVMAVACVLFAACKSKGTDQQPQPTEQTTANPQPAKTPQTEPKTTGCPPGQQCNVWTDPLKEGQPPDAVCPHMKCDSWNKVCEFVPHAIYAAATLCQPEKRLMAWDNNSMHTCCIQCDRLSPFASEDQLQCSEVLLREQWPCDKLMKGELPKECTELLPASWSPAEVFDQAQKAPLAQ